MITGKTTGEVLRQGAALLRQQEGDSVLRDAALLFCSAFGMDRETLYSHPEQPADDVAAEKYISLCRRRAAGEPLQYLLEKWGFMDFELRVGRGVLVPRPETELLAETVVRFISAVQGKHGEALELCAGSGCVSIAVARVLPEYRVTACELMPEAFAYLESNAAELCGNNLRAVLCDALALPESITGLRYDAVFANPPYLTEREMRELSAEVRSEPAEALYGGEDGLDFYRRLPEIVFPLLKNGGLLAFETGWQQGEAVAELMKTAGFTGTGIKKDLSGRDRVVTGLKP